MLGKEMRLLLADGQQHRLQGQAGARQMYQQLLLFLLFLSLLIVHIIVHSNVL